MIDMTNEEFGKLKVIKPNGTISKNGEVEWLCKCKCGKTKIATRSFLKKGDLKSCGCSRWRGNRWKGYMDIPMTYWNNIIIGANKRNYIFDITIVDAWEKLEEQQHKCALSNIDISFYNKTASLDRIDNSLGYTKTNIQWLHKTVNKIKHNLIQSEFIRWCQLITSHQNDISI